MRLILGIILFCWFGPYLLLNDGAIRKDFSLRSESLTLALIPTTDRKCSSTMMLFHQCSYKYEHNGETQTQNYNMFAFGAPKKLLLMKGVDSGLLTSTTGQEYLWNRLLTVIFAMFVSLMAFFGGLRLFFGGAPTPQNQQRMPQQQLHQITPAPQPPQQARARGQSGFGKRTGFSR